MYCYTYWGQYNPCCKYPYELLIVINTVAMTGLPLSETFTQIKHLVISLLESNRNSVLSILLDYLC